MARGNRGRGGQRGHNSNQSRGRGRDAPRGRGNGRGRGRGGQAYITLDDFDFPIQQWPSNQPPDTGGSRGSGYFRGRGRGRGAHSFPGTGFTTPRGGNSTPRGRGRGRGESDAPDDARRDRGNARNLTSRLNAGAPLSKMLYESNIFLKPIKFVRSVHTATLFTQEEEIFQPVVEAAVEGDEKSHVPTAETVSRVFNMFPEKGDNSSGEEEEIEEVDFADIGKLQAAVDAAEATKSTSQAKATVVKEEAAFFVDTTPMALLSATNNQRIPTTQLQGALGEASDDEDDVIVYVAPHPRIDRSTPTRPSPAEPIVPTPIPSTSILTGLSIGASTSSAPPSTAEATVGTALDQSSSVQLSLETLFPEETTALPEPTLTGIAPDAADLPPPPSFDSVAFSFNTTTPKKQTRRLHPVGTPRSLLRRSRKPRRKSLPARGGFGAYGAMHEEALLHEVDPRRAEQRRGDSDVNWGDSDSDDAVEELSTGIGDMEIDEGISLAAMKKFVHSMSAQGSQHVTMDDVADMQRMREEDEEEHVRGVESAEDDEDARETREGPAASDDDESESESESEDEEVEAIVQAEEAELIGEGGSEVGDSSRTRGTGGEGDRRDSAGDESDEDDEDDEDDEEDSSDDDETPKRRFQSQLERLRSQPSKGKGKARAMESDDSSDEAMSVQMTWADEDEEQIEAIQAFLDENQQVLDLGDRKSKKLLFAAIRDGNFPRDMFADSAPAKRGKDKDVPPELREQWEKDRAKKAENKRKRALERMQLAADPLAQHKGGKKGRKAMLAAARAAPDADLPNRITDLVSLERQIRRFLADIGGSNTMSLPPADKETRKQVHELATAFNLKSKSVGKGDARYTTLTKTSRSGIGINEKKIRHILRQAKNGAWTGADGGRGKGRSKAMSLATHREGEVVGKEAPKIGASNLGFKMLAAMGWSDGDRIGLSGGLEAPLTAIMKKTKLGLGASAQA